jgi:hypothetical protein
VPGASATTRTRRFWLECGLQRTPVLHAEERAVQVLTWRIAVGWRGPLGATAGLVLPIAVTERRADRVRGWLVPDPTLVVAGLATALAAWLVFGVRPRRAPARRGT